MVSAQEWILDVESKFIMETSSVSNAPFPLLSCHSAFHQKIRQDLLQMQLLNLERLTPPRTIRPKSVFY